MDLLAKSDSRVDLRTWASVAQTPGLPDLEILTCHTSTAALTRNRAPIPANNMNVTFILL